MAWYLGASELTVILPAGVSIGTSTLPLTLGEVGSIIVEFEGEVDGYLSAAGYTVPVATSASYAFVTVQRAVRNGAGAAVLDVLFPTMGGPADKTSASSVYRKAYDDFKKAIASGNLALVGAGKDTGETGRVLPRSGGVASPFASMDTCF